MRDGVHVHAAVIAAVPYGKNGASSTHSPWLRPSTPPTTARTEDWGRLLLLVSSSASNSQRFAPFPAK